MPEMLRGALMCGRQSEGRLTGPGSRSISTTVIDVVSAFQSVGTSEKVENRISQARLFRMVTSQKRGSPTRKTALRGLTRTVTGSLLSPRFDGRAPAPVLITRATARTFDVMI